MDYRFLKFFILFYAYNKYSERHCGIYLRFTCIFGNMSRVGIPKWSLNIKQITFPISRMACKATGVISGVSLKVKRTVHKIKVNFKSTLR